MGSWGYCCAGDRRYDGVVKNNGFWYEPRAPKESPWNGVRRPKSNDFRDKHKREKKLIKQVKISVNNGKLTFEANGEPCGYSIDIPQDINVTLAVTVSAPARRG